MTRSVGIAALLGVALWGSSALADGNGKCNPTPNCDAAKTFCFGSLDLDPITCGVYYGCCYGDPSPPIGDPDCRNQPCGPGCPSDLCAQGDPGGPGSFGLTQGSSAFSTDLAVGAAATGNLTVEIGADRQGRIFYNWWNLGQGGHGWRELEGRGQTNATPAAALVSRKYLFVVIKGTDGYLYLNQGDVARPFVGWQRMGFQTRVAPGATSSGKLTAVVAVDRQGKVFYNWWALGEGGKGWQELDGRPTDAAPAAALVGGYLFVVIKGLDGSLYLNQGALGKPFVGWQRMGFQTDVAPGAASAGNISVIVAKDRQGRIFYNWWPIGQGGHGWQELPGLQTNLAPAAALVGNYLFVMARGRDGKLYLNQGDLGKPFVGWK